MRLASARDVAKLGKLRTDLAIRQPLSFELLGQCDGFRHALGIALAAFALTVGLPLAISGRLKLSGFVIALIGWSIVVLTSRDTRADSAVAVDSFFWLTVEV